MMHHTTMGPYVRRSFGWVGLLSTVLWVGMLWGGSGEAQTFFEDVTEEAIEVPEIFTRGAAFGDYHNDGWPDLFLSETAMPGTRNRFALLRNEGGRRFVDGRAAIQADIPNGEKTKGACAVFGDYDNDGDLDLFIPVGAWRSRGLNALLRNDRGVFHGVTQEAGLTEELPSDNVIWLDYNRDGYLDLYVGNVFNNPTDRNKLYRNNGDGTFTDMTEEAGLDIPFHPTSGGSNGGMAAGDFNEDGWPDLYVGVFQASNRLFLNDGQGGFRDATTSEIADTSMAYGVAVGDIDNDGDLDIFQAAGGAPFAEENYQSIMLLNLSEAEPGIFLDVTKGVGLTGVVAAQMFGAGLADIDNDGDLDLITANPHFLYLNNGDGTFEDRTSQSGIAEGASVSFGDYNLDGFLDVWCGDVDGESGLYRNSGNDHHYLRVEVVGTKSNRTGIGARLIATSGDLTQTREMLGGTGYSQDEMVAHFGLGQRTQVDRLEIRWPLGGVDVLGDVPADQKIRVFEGRESYHVITPTTWVWEGPDSLVAGSTVDLKATVRPARFEAQAEIVSVRADLSDIGGPSDTPLMPLGDDRYRLESTFTVDGPSDWRGVSVGIDQETSLESYWTNLRKTITVLPGVWPSEDLVIYEEGLGPGWSVEVFSPAESDPTSSTFAHGGSVSHAISLWPEGKPWGRLDYRLDDLAGVDPSGYTHVEFYISGGDTSGQDPTIAGKRLSDLGIVPQSDTWTRVSIPLSEIYLDERGRLTHIAIVGMVRETFYLDDMKLVAREKTDIDVSDAQALPLRYVLSQNYPNPFNPITTIAYDLPQASDVTLTLYTITGQKVATLVSHHQETGHYEVVWDGSGCANGVYLYHLKAGEFAETRRMLLLK